MAEDLGHAQRKLSNIGHWAEGGLFAALGILVLLQASGTLSRNGRFAIPVLLLAAGAFLPIFLFGHGHGTPGHAKEVAADSQQRQHLVMAALLFVSGFAQLALSAGWVTTMALAYVWPGALAIIGVMFMLHTQHGDHAAMQKAIRFHRLLGTILVLSGVAYVVALHQGRAFAHVHGALLLVVAALLITYREPEGAYAAGTTGDGRGGHAGTH